MAIRQVGRVADWSAFNNVEKVDSHLYGPVNYDKQN